MTAVIGFDCTRKAVAITKCHCITTPSCSHSNISITPQICCHSFRATGITEYMRNGGTLEKAQQMAAHASSRTTNMYNRACDEVTLDEVEPIVI